jgi:hypothetical protein
VPRIEPIKHSSSIFGDRRSRDRVKANVVSHTSTHSFDTFQEGEQALGEYKGERWWDSKQTWCPIFDSSLRQYDIRKPDGTLWTQTEADALCKAFPLNYPDDWKNPSDRGKRIERADIRTYGDAYFSHPDLKMRSVEGVLDIPDSEWGNVLLAIAAGNPGVKQDDGKSYRSGDEKYFIKNPEKEREREDAKIDNALEAQDLFRALEDGDGDLQRMADILVLFGEDVDVSLGKSQLRKRLFKYFNDSVTTDGGGRVRQDLFREYAKIPPDDLKLRALVKKGIHRGLISQRAGSYYFKDTFVGSSSTEVELYFKARTDQASQALENLKAELKNDLS